MRATHWLTSSVCGQRARCEMKPGVLRPSLSSGSPGERDYEGVALQAPRFILLPYAEVGGVVPPPFLGGAGGKSARTPARNAQRP